MEEKKTTKGLVSPLRNEIVTVRFIVRKRGIIDDKKHVLYGGMHDNSIRTFTTPLLRSGGFVNVLTKDEMAYLEKHMGLEPGALSVHNRGDKNFWSDANPNGIGKITLSKGDTQLNLADPLDYIRYKILLAHKDKVAPSLKALQDYPKATYEYLIVSDSETSEMETMQVNIKQKAWMEFGKISENPDILKLVIETIEGRPVSDKVKLEYLQTKVGELVDHNPKMFVTVAQDPLISTKILIKKAISAGILSRRGTFIYLRKDNKPLCGDGQDPTMSVAAAYLDMPQNQELKFSIEAQVKSAKG